MNFKLNTVRRVALTLLFACATLTAHAQAVSSAPFAQGTLDGDLKWELRLTLPQCNVDAKPSTYCEADDIGLNAARAGIESKLESWLNNPEIKSVHIASLSYSNPRIKTMLCEAAQRGVKITAFLDSGGVEEGENEGELGEVLYRENIQSFENCSPNTEVIIRGEGYESSNLQHMKIFMASEFEYPVPLHELDLALFKKTAAKSRLYFTSSSANFSNFGASLHFENWLFFDAQYDDYIAQKHLCVFDTFRKVDNRTVFATKLRECFEKIEVPKRDDMYFFAVPLKETEEFPGPYMAMKELVLGSANVEDSRFNFPGAKQSLDIAIHRLTIDDIYKDIFATAAERGIPTRIIYDDDTLRASRKRPTADDSEGIYSNNRKKLHSDVKGYRVLRKQPNVDMRFIETNGRHRQYMHNKFFIVDDEYLFQGAGNFTGTSLNIDGNDNFENFYVFKSEGIVEAYRRAFETLWELGLSEAEHPAGALP